MSASIPLSLVPGYELGETLVEGRRTVLVRGRSAGDGASVLIKLLRSESPTAHDVAVLRREFEVARAIAGDGVLRPRELVRAGARLALVHEGFDGVPLRNLLSEGGLDVRTVLELGARAAHALAQIHRHEVIHKNLSPASLLVSARGADVRLTDFSICTRLAREETRDAAGAEIEGELGYVSPEQTGRMNRSVDFRADLYSLGVTLYEMLTGRRPFDAEDPLELVHCHIARVPDAPAELRAEVPALVSDVVMKLLAKRAEDRYQSASGLRADLESALESWRATGRVAPMDLGRADSAARLEIAEQLYGREREVALLMAAFERVCSGRAELYLVSGYSGVGKSALVHELHKPIVARKGSFAAGKFDQFRRDSPYSALLQALEQVVRQALTRSEERVAALRARLLAVLGDSGRILTELIPSLELIVGPQQPVQPLPPTEAQIRFNLLLHQLVLAFASAEHPLALFLDDLQWADSATLGLLQRFTTDPDARHLLLIGAYRDNEVDLHHPLILALAEIKKSGARVSEESLRPLGVEDLGRLVADTLRAPVAEVEPLTRLVHEKTGGNPFHVNQFLHSLHEQGLLRLDEERRAWSWDVERIEREEITSNVVELMVQKLRRLPAPTQKVLWLAACVGNRFDLETLSVVDQSSQEVAGARIWNAVREGLVLPVGNSYKLLEAYGREGDASAEASAGLHIAYRFLHDRVQQAAYALIPEGERRAIHCRIGRLLRDGQGEERVFEVVGHLNLGAELVTDARERLGLAELNLRAGRRAIGSSAYDPAAGFLAAGIELLPADAWESHYELSLALHTAATEAEFMRLRPERAEKLAATVLRRARRPIEKIEVYELRIQHEISQARLSDSLDTALEALALLGIRLPRHPSKLQVLAAFAPMRLRLARYSMDDLRALPEMSDPEKLAAMRLLLRVSPAAYQSAPELLALIICQEMDLILRHGKSYHAAQAYGSWAVLLCEITGEVRGTYEFGRLGVEVAHQCPQKDVQSRSIYYFTAFHQHWAEPQADSDALMTRYQAGFIEGGDLQFYGYSVFFPIYLSFFAGRELEPLVERFHRARASLARLQLDNMLHITHVGLQAVLNLTGRADVRERLAGEFFDSEELVPRLMGIRNHSASFFARLMDTVLAYLFGQYERAAEQAGEAVALLEAIMSTVFVVETRFYQALAELAAARAVEPSERGRGLRVARRNLKRLRRWARANPGNFAHKAELVEAELASVLGRSGRAERAYERAAAGAREHGFTHEEALAHERAALHFLALGRPTIAAAYLREAVAGWAAWGASAKIEALREEHVELLRLEPAAGGSSAREPAVSLDLQAVMRASRVISGEIVLDRLLASLLRIVVQSAGAERGVLIRTTEDGPVVVAEGDGERIDLVEREPVEHSARLPAAVVRWVLRTREPVVLEDAAGGGPFQDDPDVQARGLRSVLAVPTLNQGEVTGVLYVENNLTPGAFTPERVELLRLLASQAAVSLENAELYSDLARLNRAYERFVPRAFLRTLAKKSIVDVSLGDSVEREMTVVFADVRSFTSISEGLEPAESFAFINSLLGRMEPIIERHGGFVDKYLGDAILALFDRSPDDTVRAAAEAQEELAELNRERAARGEAEVRVGIGVNTGRVMLGTVGGPNRMDGTVVGDAVNLAQRLESMTKELGAAVLLSGETVARLQDPARHALRWLGRAQVRGKAKLVELYELLEGLPDEVIARRLANAERLAEGLRLQEAGELAAAAARFRAAIAADPTDEPARALLAAVETEPAPRAERRAR